MFYATRTQAIANDIEERQLLTFYTRAHRDAECARFGATAIRAADAKRLKPAGTSYTVAGENCVFFAQIIEGSQ